MAMRNTGPDTLAARAAAVAARHVGRGPSLIDEDGAAGVKRGLAFDPILPALHDVRAFLLAGVAAAKTRLDPARERFRHGLRSGR
jgi:hypothetical protein